MQLIYTETRTRTYYTYTSVIDTHTIAQNESNNAQIPMHCVHTASGFEANR